MTEWTVEMDNGSVWWGEEQTLDTAGPRAGRTALLSPFDNLVIQRERLHELFGFDFRIECYVPEAKRRYGYYCLHLLHHDPLIGRLDAKSHRGRSSFEIKALFVEPDFASRRQFEPIADAVAGAIREYASFEACDDIRTVGGGWGCGIGFELTFLLMPLLWVYRRRRRLLH